MKKENFIKTVISHISDTTRKAEVLAELGDHLQEKTAYFEDIGYEKETAAEKAEQALGDLEQAEIVGEQLGAVKKNKRLPRVLLALAEVPLLLMSVYCFLVHCSGAYYYIFFVAEPDPAPGSFADFLAIMSAWCVWLWLLLLCIRYKTVAGLFLSIPSGVMLSGTVMIYVIAIFKALFAFENAGKLFYYCEFGGYQASVTGLRFGWSVLALVAGITALTAAVLAIKKRRLTFNRTDNTLQHIIRVAVLSIAIVSTVFFAAVSTAALTQKQVVRERGAHTLALMDDFVLEHMEEILAEDKSAAREQLKALLKTDEVSEDLRCKADGICFYTYTINENTYFRLFSELQDIGGELIAPQDLKKAKLCDKTNPQNLPKPYALAISESSYGAGEEGIILDVFYSNTSEIANDSEDTISDKVLYRLAAGGDWEYINCVFRMSGKLYDYDTTHEEMLRSALKEKLCDVHEYEEYFDCNYDLHQKIYAVSYDKSLGQFQADMQVETDYWTFIDGKLFTIKPSAVHIIMR